MNWLVIALLALALFLVLPGLFFKAVEIMVWIGLALAVVAVILWLVDKIRGRNTRV